MSIIVQFVLYPEHVDESQHHFLQVVVQLVHEVVVLQKEEVNFLSLDLLQFILVFLFLQILDLVHQSLLLLLPLLCEVLVTPLKVLSIVCNDLILLVYFLLTQKRVQHVLAVLGQIRYFLVIVFIYLLVFDEVNLIDQLGLNVLVQIEVREAKQQVQDVEQQSRDLKERRPEIGAVVGAFVQHIHCFGVAEESGRSDEQTVGRADVTLEFFLCVFSSLEDIGSDFPLVVVLEFHRLHLKDPTLVEVIELGGVQPGSLQFLIKLRKVNVEDFIIFKVEITGWETETESLWGLFEADGVLIEHGHEFRQQGEFLF